MKPELQLRPSRARMPMWQAWVLGGAFMAAMFLRDLLTFDHGMILGADFWGRDFMNAWTAGHLIREGRVGVLDDVNAYSAYLRSFFGHVDPHNYSYPPVTYPIAAALSFLPYWLALTVWLGGTGALFVHACRRWWPERSGPAWLVLLSSAALVNIWDGQYGFLIGALFLLGWQWLDEHPRRAGIAFGLMLVKPHLAILIPLVLLIRRDGKAFVSAAATVALLVAGSIVCFGIEPWIDFVFHTGVGQASMIDPGQAFYRFLSTSMATAVMGLGVGWTPSLLIQAIIAAAGIAMVCIAAQRRIATRELAFLVATCTFLVLPYAFNYDLTVVCVGALALMTTAGMRDMEYRAGFYGFVAPQIGMITAIVGVSLMPVMLLALAAGQFHCWVMRHGKETAVQLPASFVDLASPQHS
jgi:hypothetical protein